MSGSYAGGLVALVALTVMTGGAGTAAAQSTGVWIPTHSLAEPDGANAINDNPAGLTTLGGWEARLYNTQLTEARGEGTAVFFAQPIWKFGFGTGLEVLRPADASTYLRLSLAVGFEIHPAVRIGFATRFYFSDHDSELDSGFSLDLALLLRPVRWLSVGVSVVDVDTPDLGQGILPRRYGASFAFHPGTDRVSLEVGAQVAEDTGNTDILGRIAFSPIAGLELGVNTTVSPRDGEVGFQLGTSVAFQFGMAGIEGGVLTQRPTGGDVAYDGFTVGARLSEAVYPKLYERGDRTVVVDVGGLSESPSASLTSESRGSFTQTLVYLYRLARDESVTGVVLRDRGSSPGWAQAEELREAIADLRAHGKDVTAYLDQGETRQMFMYAGCSRIVLNPAGGIVLTGLSSTVTFLKDVLDKLRIDTQFVQFEEYKSFPEQFTRSTSSAPATEVRNSLLDGLFGQITSAIDRDRHFTIGTAARLVDEGPYVAAEALDRKLVDSVAFWDELTDVIRQATGHPVTFLPAASSATPGREPWGRNPVIAIIPVEGSIVDGMSSKTPFVGSVNVGGDTIARAVEAAAADPHVVGILVRVDSPGGSSLASDKMFRALQKAAQKKPVVASFGNTAASGGYYLAMGATEIFASDATITGSIGIFTGKPSFKRLFDLVGVGRDTITRGKRADLFTTDRLWTDEEVAVIRQKLEALYNLFLDRVAKNRKMEVPAVRALARGRVWLGSQAIDQKLVDSRGGVISALNRVKALAGLADDAAVELVFLPEPTLLDRVRATLGVEIELLVAAAPALAEALESAFPFLNAYSPGEPLMLMPYRIELR